MGKAKILGGGDGVYDITYYFDVSHATKELAKLDADIAAADIQIANLINLRDAQQAKVDVMIAALNSKIATFAICASSLPVCSTYQSQLTAINTAIDKLEQEKLLLFGYTEAVERMKGDKLSNEKRRGFLTSLTPPQVNVTVYSVDNPEDDDGDMINTTVGTVDPMGNHGSLSSSLDQPRVHTILRPLYSNSTYTKARDKAATPIAGMGVAQTMGVVAQYPYAIKYNPRWMTAIITAVDNALGLVDIDVYANTPTDPAPTAFKTTPLFSIPSVPVQYMECGVFAFRKGDYVIVEFGDVGRKQPVVIGFVRQPRKCPRYNGWWINGGKYVHSSYDISTSWTWLANAGIGGNLSWTGWGKGGGGVKTVSWWGRMGKHYGIADPRAARAKNAYMDGQTYTFPYAVFGCCARRETVGPGVKHWFIYALCRPQAATDPFDGTFEAGSGFDEHLYKIRDDGVGGAVVVWATSADLPMPDGSARDGDGPAFAYVNTAAVFFNQSATAGVCVAQDMGSPFPFNAFVVRYNLSTSARTISYASPPAGANSATSFSAILAIEYDNDAEKALNYRQTITSILSGPDPWMKTEWSIDVDGFDLERGTTYSAGHFGYLEKYGSMVVILAANLRALGLVLAIRDYELIAQPQLYKLTYRLKVMGDEMYSNVMTVDNPGDSLISAGFVTDKATLGLGGFAYPITRGMHMAHGPDGKYVFYAGAFADITNEPDPSDFPSLDVWSVGRFTGSGPFMFKSNDIVQGAFEAQSGGVLPYSPHGNDLGVI